MSRRNFPHRSLLHRMQAGKPEHMMWQSHYAAYDYPLWSLKRVYWQFNPFTGTDYLNMLNDNPNIERLIHLPDATYWEAMGMYHPREDGSIKVRHDGLWLNRAERECAEDDDEFITEAMRQARQPIFNRTTPNYRTARRSASQTAGRASSRGASASARR